MCYQVTVMYIPYKADNGTQKVGECPRLKLSGSHDLGSAVWADGGHRGISEGLHHSCYHGLVDYDGRWWLVPRLG